MERIQETLRAMQGDPERAPEILMADLDRDRLRVVAGLAAFILAALAGIVIGPDDL